MEIFVSGNVNVGSKKKVLIVAANPAQSPVTGWPTGFWWAELTHPYWAFTEAGYEIEIRSPEGGTLSADGFSDPEDESQYSAHDILSLGFKKSAAHMALLQETKSIKGVNPSDYDAVFLIGGQSPMITFFGNQEVYKLVANFYEAGKVTALVCHATCVLLEAKLSTGEFIVSNKTWTGFADQEERYAEDFVKGKLQPFWIETEARKIPNSNFVIDQPFRPFAVRDGLLITGQQQFSGNAAARLVIEALGR